MKTFIPFIYTILLHFKNQLQNMYYKYSNLIYYYLTLRLHP